jgi:hypothetical protein
VVTRGPVIWRRRDAAPWAKWLRAMVGRRVAARRTYWCRGPGPPIVHEVSGVLEAATIVCHPGDQVAVELAVCDGWGGSEVVIFSGLFVEAYVRFGGELRVTVGGRSEWVLEISLGSRPSADG